jgi:hypothetical protein
MRKNIILFIVCGLMSLAQAQSVTWADNIACIVYTNCTKCHNPNGAGPFSLLTYTDAVSQSSAIKGSTQSKYMPPWSADRSYRSFAHERYLTQEEIDLIANWVDNGSPQGNMAHAPTTPVYTSSEEIVSPDAQIQIPTYTVSGIGDIYRCFVLDPGISVNQFVTGLEVVPGNRSIVHHVLIYADTTGIPAALDSAEAGPGYAGFGGTGSSNSTLIGAWVPGSAAYFYPAGMGSFLPANAKIIAQIHYPQGSAGMIDSTHINLKLTTYPFTRNVTMAAALNHSIPSILDGPLVIPANQVKTFHFRYNAPSVDLTILSVAPHMHLVGVSVKAYAVTPLGDTINLVNIPKWDFHWQGAYQFRQPLRLPANSVVYGVATYDNTTANPHNPNSPPQLVTVGESTTNEMMLVYFGALVAFPGDNSIVIDTSTIKSTYNDCQYKTGFSSIDVDNDAISVYPNPANNTLNISTREVFNIIKIYNYLGEMVLKENNNLLARFNIETNDLASGEYVIVFTKEDQIISKKISILH